MTDGRRWQDSGVFPFFFCRSNSLRELNSILYPLRITSCHRNTRKARQEDARVILIVKLTFANARSVSEWLKIRPKLPTTPFSVLGSVPADEFVDAMTGGILATRTSFPSSLLTLPQERLRIPSEHTVQEVAMESTAQYWNSVADAKK